MCLLDSFFLRSFAGASRQKPEDFGSRASGKARELAESAFADLGGEPLHDLHAHVVGLGAGGTGNWVNPAMRSWRNPFRRLQFAVYAQASGIRDEADADAQFARRLIALVKTLPGRARVQTLAFDRHYRRNGVADLENSEFYVPNEYAFALSQAHSDIFSPTISVNPYRADAIQELEQGAARGARFVKWLPNAMGIDPSDALCANFYSKMREKGMWLLTHGGEEKAVHSEEFQKLGNPLLLRKPLEMGVRVIVAHCASLGTNEDLDQPGAPRAKNFELFLRLMGERRFEGLLFGEISAMTQYNRAEGTLETLLARPDLHPRLFHGSDYPLPAINLLIQTKKLARLGLLDGEDVAPLQEIYDYNPLLFDFVLKRRLRHPKTRVGFSTSIFHGPPAS